MSGVDMEHGSLVAAESGLLVISTGLDTSSKSEQPDVTLVRQLAGVLDTSRLTMIEVKQGGRQIRIKRDAPAVGTTHHIDTLAIAIATEVPPPAFVPETALTEASEMLRASIVGTAHLGREPNAAPFVSVGQSVSVGDTLLVIEAMKVRNPIIARRNGTIVEVLVNDGWPVEYDQPLMIIE